MKGLARAATGLEFLLQDPVAVPPAGPRTSSSCDEGPSRIGAPLDPYHGTLQMELLDEHRWVTRKHLALAVFDWIEAWYNPLRRHSYCGMLSPVDHEPANAA